MKKAMLLVFMAMMMVVGSTVYAQSDVAMDDSGSYRLEKNNTTIYIVGDDSGPISNEEVREMLLSKGFRDFSGKLDALSANYIWA